MRLESRLRTIFRTALLACLGAGSLRAQCPAPPTPCIVLSASTTSLQGGQKSTLTATVTGPANPAVTWSANPVVVGATLPATGSLNGSVTTNTFTAPSLVTVKQAVTVTATSVADSNYSASVVIQLTPVTARSILRHPHDTKRAALRPEATSYSSAHLI